MRRVAAGLGVGTMTLYTYVPDKEQHELAQERAGTDPRHDAETQARYLHKAVVQYDLPRLTRLLTTPVQEPPPTFGQLLDRMIEGFLG